MNKILFLLFLTLGYLNFETDVSEPSVLVGVELELPDAKPVEDILEPSVSQIESAPEDVEQKADAEQLPAGEIPAEAGEPQPSKFMENLSLVVESIKDFGLDYYQEITVVVAAALVIGGSIVARKKYKRYSAAKAQSAAEKAAQREKEENDRKELELRQKLTAEENDKRNKLIEEIRELEKQLVDLQNSDNGPLQFLEKVYKHFEASAYQWKINTKVRQYAIYGLFIHKALYEILKLKWTHEPVQVQGLGIESLTSSKTILEDEHRALKEDILRFTFGINKFDEKLAPSCPRPDALSVVAFNLFKKNNELISSSFIIRETTSLRDYFAESVANIKLSSEQHTLACFEAIFNRLKSNDEFKNKLKKEFDLDDFFDFEKDVFNKTVAKAEDTSSAAHHGVPAPTAPHVVPDAFHAEPAALIPTSWGLSTHVPAHDNVHDEPTLWT